MRFLLTAASLLLVTAVNVRADVPATSAPTCADPFRDARVIHAASPTYPDSARSLRSGPILVLVEVSVGPSGKVVMEAMNRSSGYPVLDMAALLAARQSTYATKLINCKPTTGDVILRVVLDPNAPTPSPAPQ